MKKMAIDTAKIKMAIRSGAPLSVLTYTLPQEMTAYMHDVLAAFLNELDQKRMTPYLTFCIDELTSNAEKANTKRVYFKENDLDIEDSLDYRMGVAALQKEPAMDIDYYVQRQKLAHLYIKLILQKRSNALFIEVRNNAELTVFEYKRIHDKLTRAQQYGSIEEALTQVSDGQEGAGLGIVVMLLMLEKIGVGEENFQTISENGETIMRIIVPLGGQTEKRPSFISAEFAKAIDNLPQLPDNIMRLNRLLSAPESEIADIAVQIAGDVTLTEELLRLANSAAFGLAKQCENIEEAVKLVGLRGIKNLLYSIGAFQSLIGVAGSKEEFWTHANQVAFYANDLARNFCADDRAVINDAYVCGLLHDMGKIIFETTHPGLVKRIAAACKNKNATTGAFEMLVSGVTHGEIGARIAEKWNFPDTITDVIRYHHAPKDAPKELYKLTALVNLADLIAHYQRNQIYFEQMDADILALFGIASEAQLMDISNQMFVAYRYQ